MIVSRTEIEKAYRYCEGVTRLHARSFYFAAKFLPRRKQRAVYPIYAFCRHVDDEIDETGERDEAAAVIVVRKWEERLKKVYRTAEAPASPSESRDTVGRDPANGYRNQVFLAWEDLLRTYHIPREIPLDLIRGVLMDTTTKRYQTFNQLYVYCYRVASTVGLMSSEILGYADREALRYAEAMGIAMQLTNILRDIKEDARMGRIYLPREDLERFGVTEKEILAGEFSDDFRELMKFQIARARKYYRRGEKGIRYLEKDSRFCVLFAARIYAKILDEIEKLDHNVFVTRAHTTRGQKLMAIPRIWREAKRI